MNYTELDQLMQDKGLTLTPLREDVLKILAASQKPLGAYDILNKLKRKRPNAQPPTVYRVLEFLSQTSLIHRIESQNTYVCCSSLNVHHPLHRSILLICKACQHSFEYADKTIFSALSQFAKKNALQIDDTLIEMQGLCTACQK